MELKVKMTLPTLEDNFEDLVKQAEAEILKYEGSLYLKEDKALAKADRAKLNALATQINSKRIELEKEYLAPFQELKDKINKFKKRIDKASKEIGDQIKAFEEEDKRNKEIRIKEIFEEQLDGVDLPFVVNYELLFDPKMLNASMSEKKIASAFQHRLLNIESEVKSILLLGSEFETDLLKRYAKALDLNDTLILKNQLEQAKATAEAKIEEELAKETEEVAQQDLFSTPHIVPRESESIPIQAEKNLPVKEYMIMITLNDQQKEDLISYLKENNIPHLF